LSRALSFPSKLKDAQKGEDKKKFSTLKRTGSFGRASSAQGGVKHRSQSFGRMEVRTRPPTAARRASREGSYIPPDELAGATAAGAIHISSGPPSRQSSFERRRRLVAARNAKAPSAAAMRVAARAEI